ncbi:hypothetical protein [Burkholderia metallica]|uniref:hypothetical protein n=1 Tax=Burkholderia metallica TaxID=488729 RepID=UPI00131C3C34|nr:hypothetical protein [Burkholderia metallica]
MTSALGVATFTARDPSQELVPAGAQRPTFNVQRSLPGAARVIRDPSTSFRSAIALRQAIGGLDSTGYETKPPARQQEDRGISDAIGPTSST